MQPHTSTFNLELEPVFANMLTADTGKSITAFLNGEVVATLLRSGLCDTLLQAAVTAYIHQHHDATTTTEADGDGAENTD